MSPAMSRDVEHYLNLRHIKPLNLHAKLFTKKLGLSTLWFETWGREALFNLNSRQVKRDCHATINFSHTVVVPSTFWYLQGPTSSALKDMKGELTTTYKSVYTILKPALEYLDKKLAQHTMDASTFVVANSKFCALLYHDWGIRAYDIIYPPVDCKLFQRTSSDPSNDYVLTYFGKETKFSVVKSVADRGVRIRAFGSKAPFVPRSVMMHPNINFLGRITVNELVENYSNALFTLFAFTHEPFGYIPVESMSCGTPTLTYRSQGPGESIINGYTGWLVETDEELVCKASSLWRYGYSSRMRSQCVKAASSFDKKLYVEKWLKIMKSRKVLES